MPWPAHSCVDLSSLPSFSLSLSLSLSLFDASSFHLSPPLPLALPLPYASLFARRIHLYCTNLSHPKMFSENEHFLLFLALSLAREFSFSRFSALALWRAQ